MSVLLSLTLLLSSGADAEVAAPRKTMPITLPQCIYLGEQNSVPLRIDEVDVQISKAEVGRALGTFDTVAFFDGSYQKTIRPEASRLATGSLGGAGLPTSTEVVVTGVTSNRWAINTGFRGMLLNGSSYTVDANWTKSDTSAGTFGGFNPEYRSDIGVSFTQPLLRGFGTTVNKAPVMQAKNAMVGAAENLEANRGTRAQQVVIAYWDLYFARRTLDTREFLVEQAERLVRINQKKYDVGELKRIDVIEAESDLASRQKDRIEALNEIGRTADELKRLIFPFDGQDEWDVELVPLTEAQETAVDPPDWQAAAAVALDRRAELRQRRELLKNDDLQIVIAENALLPRLDVTATLRFNQLAASKGQVLNYDEDLYSAGGAVHLEMPLGNRTARYDASIARLQKIRSLLEFQDLENEIIQEVRNAVRDVRNRKKEIDAAREAVKLAEERWNAEQKRQEVGYSTTFQVRDAERAWREAVDAELRALFDYQVALTALDRAQGTLLESYGILESPKPHLDDRAGVHFDS